MKINIRSWLLLIFNIQTLKSLSLSLLACIVLLTRLICLAVLKLSNIEIIVIKMNTTSLSFPVIGSLDSLLVAFVSISFDFFFLLFPFLFMNLNSSSSITVPPLYIVPLEALTLLEKNADFSSLSSSVRTAFRLMSNLKAYKSAVHRNYLNLFNILFL